ncbi:MAG: putative membrane protein [Parcubacteria group bacterium GW2011_GWA2_39_18]|nr:MAG: putative membrane protein [Parcubacteria group bacterium GW2011_GWA2_39_18]
MNPISFLINNFNSFVKNFSFGWNNFFDVLILAILISLAIAFIRKTRSMPILLGILAMAIVYGFSVWFDFPLVRRFFGAFFGTFLLILVIIFQKEIRRFLEIIGIWGIKRKITSPTDLTLLSVSEAVKYFIPHKIGSLIVFSGQEPIERFLEGGTDLNGEVSTALLTSIFDDSSPGHDGATIIKGNKLKKFAVHLPLGENIEAVKHFGTRHRAALGLSEKTDALCIVTSEEKGTISIAKDGLIYQIKNDQELKDEMKSFILNKFPERRLINYKKWIWQNLIIFFSSLILSTMIWLGFNYGSINVQRNFMVPLEFKNLMENYQINEYRPQEVAVTLSGKNIDFSSFDPRSLKASISLEKIFKIGWHKILIKNQDIARPNNFSVIKIDPSIIQINLIN